MRSFSRLDWLVNQFSMRVVVGSLNFLSDGV